MPFYEPITLNDVTDKLDEKNFKIKTAGFGFRKKSKDELQNFEQYIAGPKGSETNNVYIFTLMVGNSPNKGAGEALLKLLDVFNLTVYQKIMAEALRKGRPEDMVLLGEFIENREFQTSNNEANKKGFIAGLQSYQKDSKEPTPAGTPRTPTTSGAAMGGLNVML